MLRRLAVVAGLAAMLGAGSAIAGTPFGGDDSGFVPPNKTVLGCESAVSKAISKLVSCIIKCHIARASGKLADATAEENCEKNNGGKSCKEKFTATITKLNSKKCPGQCAVANATANGSAAEAILDGLNGTVYCESPSGAFLD